MGPGHLHYLKPEKDEPENIGEARQEYGTVDNGQRRDDILVPFPAGDGDIREPELPEYRLEAAGPVPVDQKENRYQENQEEGYGAGEHHGGQTILEHEADNNTGEITEQI